jgi:mutator protein MutT
MENTRKINAVDDRPASSQVIHVAVGVVVETRCGGCSVLITQRCEGAVLGGYWEFPGGKIAPGETPRQCVQRELREEVDLNVTAGVALPVVEHGYAHGWVRLQAFLCTRLSGEPRHVQVAQHRWVRPNELSGYAFLPANRVLLEHLERVL